MFLKEANEQHLQMYSDIPTLGDTVTTQSSEQRTHPNQDTCFTMEKQVFRLPQADNLTHTQTQGKYS